MPLTRSNNSPSSSSNMNNAAFSPRAIAATTKNNASSDLPVPAGPSISVLDPRSMPPPSKLIELRDAARHLAAHEIGAMLRRHQSRKYVHAAGRDGDVMVAATKSCAAIFDDAHAPPLGAIVRRQFLEPDHPMGDAVHGLVGDFCGQVVQQHHRGAELREIVLYRQDLPPVAQRTLSQQPDLGQAVEDDAVGPRRARRLRESAWWSRPVPGPTNIAGFAAARVEQAFGRQQLEHLNTVFQRPAVEAAPSRSSRSVSDSVIYRHFSPAFAPSSKNCSAIVVLPVPGAPSRRNTCPRENPPDKILSSPEIPLLALPAVGSANSLVPP